MIYQVAPGKLMAADALKSTRLKAVQTGVPVAEAHVVQTDIVTDNGVMHVSACVRLPT